MESIPQAWCRQAETVARLIVPEWIDLPVYCLVDADLPREFRHSQECDGWTSPDLAQTLGRAPGPAVVICKAENEPDFWGVALHEFAHAAEVWNGPLASGLKTPLAPQVKQRITEALTSPLPAGLLNHPARHHGWKFIRLLVHLTHRAELLEVKGGEFRAALDFLRWGMSSYHRYRDSLGDELEILQQATAAEILKAPHPSAFRALWLGDDIRSRLTFATYFDERTKPVDILSKLLSALADRGQKRIAGFEELAHSIADGKTPKIDQVEAILAEARKTPEQLADRVEEILHRRELARKVDDGITAEQERQVIEKQLDAAKAELAKAQARYDEAVAPLYERHRATTHRMAEAQRAADELRKTAPPELKQDVAEELASLHQVEEEMASLREKIRAAKTNLIALEEAEKGTRGQTVNPGQIENLLLRKQGYEVKLKALEARREEAVKSMEQSERNLLTVN